VVIRLLACLLALLVACPALAARVSLRAETRELEVGQRTRLTLVVVDGVPTAVPPLVADEEGLDIAYVGQSTSVRSVNFKTVRLVELSYAATALKEGTYTIGPVSVPVGDGAEEAPAVEVVVKPRPTAAASALRATAAFHPAEAWEGQVVLYTYTLRSRDPINRSRWTLPPMEGLVAPRDGDRPRTEAVVEGPDGAIYVDETIMPFVAARAGDLTQRMAVVQVELGLPGAARGAPEIVPATDAPLRVKALPPPPPGFSGLVGDVEVSGALPSAPVVAGASVKWNITVSGDASLEALMLPDAPVVDGLAFYDGPTVAGALVDAGRYRAEATLQRVVVPTRAGRVVVPDLELIVFSPTEEAYVTHVIEGATLEVSPGAGGDAAALERFEFGAAPPPVATVDGPRPVVDGAPLRGAVAGPLVGLAALGAGLPGAVVLVGAGAAALRRRRRPAPAPPRAAPTGLAASTAALDAALGAEPSTRQAALDALPADRAAPVRAAYRAIERARFGGDPADVHGAVQAALAALEGA
jgi:hypothetical protein